LLDVPVAYFYYEDELTASILQTAEALSEEQKLALLVSIREMASIEKERGRSKPITEILICKRPALAAKLEVARK
jgi:hypothetical protein